MKPTDYNNEYDEQEYSTDIEVDNDNDYDVVRIEEEYDSADSYNFYPDSTF